MVLMLLPFGQSHIAIGGGADGEDDVPENDCPQDAMARRAGA